MLQEEEKNANFFHLMLPYESSKGEEIEDLPDLAKILEIKDYTLPQFYLLVPKYGALINLDEKLDEEGLYSAERLYAWV